MTRKLPPFGRVLSERLATGWRPDNGTLFVATGADAWHLARQWSEEALKRAFIAILPEEQIQNLDLSIARGLDVVVVDTSGMGAAYVQELAVALICAGAGLVYTFRVGTDEPGQVFRPMPTRKAAA